MPTFNRVILMGNLTRDPELRYLPNNNPVVAFGLAMNRRWKNQQGEQQEEVTFVDCECFGRTAEMINQYFRKGRPLMIEGRLKLDQWQDKEGNNRSRLKVVAETFAFVDSRAAAEGGEGGSEGAEGGPPRGASRYPSGGAGGPTGGAPGGPRPAPRAPSAPPAAPSAPAAPPPAGDPHQPVGEEDIPF